MNSSGKVGCGVDRSPTMTDIFAAALACGENHHRWRMDGDSFSIQHVVYYVPVSICCLRWEGAFLSSEHQYMSVAGRDLPVFDRDMYMYLSIYTKRIHIKGVAVYICKRYWRVVRLSAEYACLKSTVPCVAWCSVLQCLGCQSRRSGKHMCSRTLLSQLVDS